MTNILSSSSAILYLGNANNHPMSYHHIHSVSSPYPQGKLVQNNSITCDKIYSAVILTYMGLKLKHAQFPTTAILYPSKPYLLGLWLDFLPQGNLIQSNPILGDTWKLQTLFCLPSVFLISRVSCQKGPTRHAYAWQIGPIWQDTLDTVYPGCGILT